jgi:formylglycine-generating enzyme required for sulfatase activity
MGDDFERKYSDTCSEKLPTFIHVSSGLEFTLIPGGEVRFGLGQEEEGAARKLADPPPFDVSALRPVSRRQVNSFLVSTGPIPIAFVTPILGDECLSEYDRRNGEPTYPAYLTREAALEVARTFGCRLPAEVEWEYACRANTKTLFPWGNALPSRKDLGKWLDLEHPTELKRNGFGLYGLFSGDWCLDQWTASHLESAPIVNGEYVIKGGGSVFWPWQETGEWKWCMPATRMSSTGLIDGRCAFRVVRDLGVTQ